MVPSRLSCPSIARPIARAKTQPLEPTPPAIPQKKPLFGAKRYLLFW